MAEECRFDDMFMVKRLPSMVCVEHLLCTISDLYRPRRPDEYYSFDLIPYTWPQFTTIVPTNFVEVKKTVACVSVRDRRSAASFWGCGGSRIDMEIVR